MKTPWEDLENELKRLEPRRPSDLLAARLASRLDASPRRWRRPAIGLTLAAAATLVLLFSPLLKHPASGTAPDPIQLAATNSQSVPQDDADPSPTASGPGALRRVAEANYLCGAADEGVVYAANATPFRRIRYQFLDTSEWRDEETRAVVRVIVPREDVLLLPMNVY